jgi:uncharacterized protein
MSCHTRKGASTEYCRLSCSTRRCKRLALCGTTRLHLRRGDLLYLHTGDHQGHFLTNAQNNPRICVEVSEIGDLHRGKPYACNSALVYTSVVVFGSVRILHGPESREKKQWFLDQLLAKYGQPEWTFEPGYPR